MKADEGGFFDRTNKNKEPRRKQQGMGDSEKNQLVVFMKLFARAALLLNVTPLLRVASLPADTVQIPGP